MKAIVVGAGPAGLSATYQLQKKGIDVTTLEARKHAGGRARGYVKDGYIIDTGAQFAASFYHETIKLMTELGKGDEFEPFNFKTAVYRNEKLYPIYTGQSHLDRLRYLPELLKFRGVAPRTVYELIKMTPHIFRHYRKVKYENWDFSGLIDIDDISVADFTLRYGGETALEDLFQPLTAYMTLGEPEEVSMSHFIAILGFFITGVWSLKHGMGEVCRTLYDACKDSVQLSTPVRKIVIEDKKVKGVETDQGLMEADAVICAVTSTTALKLMPNIPEIIKQQLSTVQYSSTCHFIFGLEKRLVPDKWYSAVIPRKHGLITTGPVESSQKSPHYAPPGGGLVHCLTYGRRANEFMEVPESELKKLMIEDIRRIIPNFPDNPPVAELHRWNEAICLQAPGQFPAVQAYRQNNYRDVKGLYLAGAYMSLFSSVEAAIRSGITAVEAMEKEA